MDYPSNSRRQIREEGDKPNPKVPPKKVERVTRGDAVRRKKPLGKRFAETFVGGDARSVMGYIMLDVLVPSAKDTIADVFTQGVERMLFGEARSSSRRTGRFSNGSTSYTPYNRYAPTRPAGQRDRDEPRHLSRRSRATHDFDEIILPTRVEGEEVVDQLFELVSKYDAASVADLYGLIGADSDHVDQKWGWTDLRGAGVTRVRGGYLLDLPRPEPLD